MLCEAFHHCNVFQLSPCFCSPSSNIRELKQRRRRRQREQQKSNWFRSVKQQLCTCITLFCTFLCRHGTTTTWTFLISRFVEDVITRQQLPFSFPELRYSLLEFYSKKICQYLTNWTRWNERDKVWDRANSLFKWRFCCLCLRCCLSSLLLIGARLKEGIIIICYFFLGYFQEN